MMALCKLMRGVSARHARLALGVAARLVCRLGTHQRDPPPHGGGRHRRPVRQSVANKRSSNLSATAYVIA